METLGDLDRSPLPEAEKAAIRFAEKMTLAHGDFEKADVEALLIHWEPGEAVEIACVAGMFNYLNRFAMTFGLWPTRPGEGGPEDPTENDTVSGNEPGIEEGATE